MLSRACPASLSEVFAKGGEGGKALAEKVLRSWRTRPIQQGSTRWRCLKQKVEAIKQKDLPCRWCEFQRRRHITAELTELATANLPVCIAGRPSTASATTLLTGAPTGFTMPWRCGKSACRRCRLCGGRSAQHYYSCLPAQEACRRQYRRGMPKAKYHGTVLIACT